MESRNLTIFVTDIKDFTLRTSHESRDQTLALLRDFKKIVAPQLEGRGGRIIKYIGDAILAVFDSPTNAVLAGIDIFQHLHEHNSASTGAPLELRVSINTGEVGLTDGDVLGEPVNVAFRLEGITDAGEIFITASTYLAMNRSEVKCEDKGEHTFKGIPDAVRVYRVKQPDRMAAKTIPMSPAVPAPLQARAESGPAKKETKIPEGTRIEGFLIERQLGDTLLGEVFIAIERKTNEQRLIRFIGSDIIETPAELAKFKTIVSRLSMLRHPNIVPLLGFGEENGRQFIVREYLSGPTLADRMKGGVRMPPLVVAKILRRAAAGLSAGHQAAFVHRDVAPYHMALGIDDDVRIIDFGVSEIAQLHAPSLPWPHDYVSPEQAEGRPLDSRSDAYSLGIIGYEMLVGEVPFRAGTSREMLRLHINEPAPLIKVRRPDVPPQLEKLIMEMLSKRPEDRPNFSTILSRLDTFLTPKPVAAAANPEHEKSLEIDRHYEKARASFEVGDLNSAESSLQKLIALREEHSRGWNLWGAVTLKKGSADEASRKFSRALAIDPDFPEAALNLGIALQRQARHAEAIWAFERATTLNPKSVQGWIHLGECRLAIRDMQAASRAWREALARKPDNIELKARYDALSKAMRL